LKWKKRTNGIQLSWNGKDKYLIQWMTETQNCENIKVDNQESRSTWHQNFLPGIWSISISSSSFMDKTQSISYCKKWWIHNVQAPEMNSYWNKQIQVQLKWTKWRQIEVIYLWSTHTQGSMPSKQSMIAKSKQPDEHENINDKILQTKQFHQICKINLISPWMSWKS